MRKKSKDLELKIINDYENGMSGIAVGEKYDCHYSTVYDILRRNGHSVRPNRINSRKYHYDENFFKEIDTEEKAYWLGFIYADGYITLRKNGNLFGLTLSITDKNHLKKIKNSLNADVPIHVYSPSRKSTNYSANKYARIQFFGEKICNDLIRQGVFAHKTAILEPPKNIPKDLISHFIRGYFDGDGSHTYYYEKTGHSSYRKDNIKILGTYNFLTWMESEISRISDAHCNGGIYKCKKTKVVYSLEYHGEHKTLFVLNALYNDATIYLDRKYQKYLNFLSYIYSRRFVKTSPLKSLELTGKPLELAKLQYSNEKSANTNA